ncbi:hypothetical protein BT69DRAFT_1279673 [Atractiella rhizophila]|nr:hypothetical protein BT69DRAFT_1279673 [Atractiella rhizophila]
MLKEVIASSPNVTKVEVKAFWNEEDAKVVLNAMAGLKRVDGVIFGKGSRRWRTEEVENFVQRTGDRITLLQAYNVEDSAPSASAGLSLPPALEYLDLQLYPALPPFSLPNTLKTLILSKICPLPPSFSDHPLPPLLEVLAIELVPFSSGRKTSILPNPLDLSHLTYLVQLILDGGEETSNLISRNFFSTLKNARAISDITLRYCVVDSFSFPDFIHWFFGDWQVRGAKKEDQVDGNRMGKILVVCLFFGEWHPEEVAISRRMIGEYTRSKSSGVWESGD